MFSFLPTPAARILASARIYTRWYNPQVLANVVGVRHRERGVALKLAEKRPKTFSPALSHFRLTRFGWEHRKAGYRGERRRKFSHKGQLLKRDVSPLNRRDLKTMHLYFPHMHLRERLAPVDNNINLTPERRILGMHIA